MYEIVDFLSEQRLSKYGDTSNENSIKEYFFNVELCESFYPLLSQFEVALRNKIDLVFSRHMGTDWIFDFVRSDPKLTDEQSITDRNELIDSMTFAFWSRLFMVDQEERIWLRYPSALGDIFSKRKAYLDIKKISYEINQIRHYRNRFSHNGSLLICQKKQMSCHTMHNLLLRMMRELEAEPVLEHIKQIDRFDNIFKRGLKAGFITCKI